MGSVTACAAPLVAVSFLARRQKVSSPRRRLIPVGFAEVIPRGRSSLLRGALPGPQSCVINTRSGHNIIAMYALAATSQV